MEHSERAHEWVRTGSIVTIESPWVRLIAEYWTDDQGKQLDYWRVEHVDSVIVMPIWRGTLLLPRPQYRPGIQELTLDLPGGRVTDKRSPIEMAPVLLKKELNLDPTTIEALRPLNEQGWVVNSSFSNQRVFGVVAAIDDTAEIDTASVHTTVPCTITGVADLLRRLECLQCRAVLQEWLIQEIERIIGALPA